jgi:hypothetical protein
MDGYQISRHPHPIEPNAADTRHFSVNVDMMVTKETEERPNPRQEVIQTRRLADVP